MKPRAASPPRKKPWVAIAVIGGVLLVGLLAAKPIYRQIQQRRATKLITSGQQRLQQSDLGGAALEAQLALQLSPGNPAALRLLAQALTQDNNLAPALQVWARLLQTDAAQPADQRTYIELSLRSGAAEAAGKEIQKLLRTAPEHPVSLWLASQWFNLINNSTQALQYAALAALRDPTNRQYMAFLSRLQYDTPEEPARSTARANLWKRAEDKDAVGLEALTFLAQRRELNAEERALLVTRLQEHPARTVMHQLLALNLRMVGVSAKAREAILSEAIVSFRTAPPEDRVRFALWLIQNHASERVLEALPEPEALTRKDFFLPYMDALADLKRWQELDQLLTLPKLPIEPAYIHAYRARCALELKKPGQATGYLQAALTAATGNSEQLYWLARYSESCGEVAVAKQALRTLIPAVNNPLPAYRELARLTERTGTTGELREVFSDMARRWPEDNAIQNDSAYLNALLGQEVASARSTAARLMTQFPDNLPFRTTLALACYRQREFPAALQAYANKNFPWQQALPNQRAVYAAVLAANNRTSDARQMLVELPLGRLREEEQMLIRNLLQ